MQFSSRKIIAEGSQAKILVVYTGGTFGMVYDHHQKTLVPYHFEQIISYLPELERLNLHLEVVTFEPLLDSSNIQPSHWQAIGTVIKVNYDDFDGFVVVHGTDTMAYSASALSFMLENLGKPVIFTGAQLPIGVARTDAVENFITALEIASDSKINEVAVYFHSFLLRGNRSRKEESSQFNAFKSENYPPLAEAGVQIVYNLPYLFPAPESRFFFHPEIDTNVMLLKIFPGMTENALSQILKIPGLKGLVLETFGAGNAPTEAWFTEPIKTAIEGGLVVVNVSQCDGGRVNQGRYATSKVLEKIGVISGEDMTAEAAITKLMCLLGRFPNQKVKALLQKNVAGEVSIP